jgi:hypothetical protein
MADPIILGAINIMNKIDPPPSKATAPAQKKPFSMGLPPLARQPFLQPKPLWEKVVVPPTAATVAAATKGGATKAAKAGPRSKG